LENLVRQISELPSIDQQLAELAPQENQLASLSAEATDRTSKLNVLGGTISTKSVAASTVGRFQAGVARWKAALESSQAAFLSDEVWPSAAGYDPLGELRSRIAAAQQHVQYALQELAFVESEAIRLSSLFTAEKIAYEDQARQLRGQIENLQTGAGDIARKGQLLRERRAQLVSLQAVYETRAGELHEVYRRRNVALDSLESIRTQRFEIRQAVANNLNKVLGPRIRLQVFRGGQTEAFAAAIADALRGSGMRYNDLVSVLAQRMSPRELLEAVENDNYTLVATCAGTTVDRAAKAVLALKESDLGEIVTVPVEDYVTFSLLDGADYKDISDLSTGQRCTVILPLVLRHTDRLLIVDQPEDHIDNAFIVDTLIQSVLARPDDGQIIFSTHNANIPVLGNADFVIQLGSDGKRGFPLVANTLDAPPAVTAITTVMEGGAQAFASRAKFYNRQHVL